MLMRTDPFRELDRLTQQVLGTAIHPAVMPMDAWRDGDELMATAAVEGAADWHVFYAYRDIKDGDGHYVVLADAAYPTAGQAAHIARHSPARILRQCEAPGSVIAEFLRLDALGDLESRRVAEIALAQLAWAHSDHPDFDQAWL